MIVSMIVGTVPTRLGSYCLRLSPVSNIRYLCLSIPTGRYVGSLNTLLSKPILIAKTLIYYQVHQMVVYERSAADVSSTNNAATATKVPIFRQCS